MVDYNELFYYSDGILYNKTDRTIRSKRGDPVNPSTSMGYYSCNINNTWYKVHRIVWEMHYGEIPEGLVVDHIDHNKKNNLIENLRVVSHKDNLRNMKMKKNNKSGVTGVCWSKAANKWRAQVEVNGKQKYLGVFKDKELAGLVVSEAREKYGFHPNHGT